MAVLIPDAIERPTTRTQAVIDKAIDVTVVEVAKWLKEEVSDELRQQLTEVLKWGRDGYRAASELESRYYWDPDAELVEILDNHGFSLMHAEREAIRAWAKEVNAQPKHKMGDVVRATWGGDTITGEVVRIDADEAQYTIRREGDKPGCGAVVNYENVLD